jgi:hypothetical protein
LGKDQELKQEVIGCRRVRGVENTLFSDLTSAEAVTLTTALLHLTQMALQLAQTLTTTIVQTICRLVLGCWQQHSKQYRWLNHI